MQVNQVKRNDEIADGLTALEFAKVFLKAWAYREYFKARKGLIFDKSSDYERGSFDDYYTVERQSYGEQPPWKIVLHFRDLWKGDDFEYTALAARDNSTAYKSRPSGRATETKFALQHCNLNSNAKSIEWAISFYRDLVEECDRLEAAEKDLGAWAQSGLDMGVSCTKPYCWSGTRFSNERLCEFMSAGNSLETLRRRLICKKCSTREPRLSIL